MAILVYQDIPIDLASFPKLPCTRMASLSLISYEVSDDFESKAKGAFVLHL